MADEEIQAIRRIRHEISARQGHDLKRLLAYYQHMEAAVHTAGKYRFEPTSFEGKPGKGGSFSLAH